SSPPSHTSPLSLHDALPISDRVVTVSTLFTQALPNFWIGVVLLLVFSQTLRWLPSVGLSSPLNLILPTIVLALPFVSVLTRMIRSEEHTSELQSRENLVCRL